MNVMRLLVSAEVNSSSHKYPNEMTCGLKQGDEGFSLPNCLHEWMVLAWLVRPATATIDYDTSYMYPHLRQKHALYRSATCLNMLAVFEF